MSALAPKTPTGASRHWVAWKTKVLNDADVMLMPNIARMAFPYLLALSADQGLEGRIPSSPRACQVAVRCDGGVPEMTEALTALCEAGLLVDDPDGDDGFLYFGGWDTNQADRSGSTTRPKTSTTSQNARRHNEGKHTTTREGCELCAATSPTTTTQDSSPSEVAVVAEAPVVEAPQSEARAVRARVWDRCTATVGIAEEEGDELIEAYHALYAKVVEQSPRLVVKGVGEATLLNIVVSHCARTFLSSTDGTGPDTGTLNVLHGLRRDHGDAVLSAIALGAKANHPVAYIQGIFKDAK